ncbi:WD repeat-containing protein 11-like [Artemia franciscana]|uniref:WD repeat-containing protein 11-like n=1 Tax=Artemia franciscana TaxID=6661 RepID=UPI0032DA11EB
MKENVLNPWIFLSKCVPENKTAIDCCQCGLLAYGSKQLVIIVDTKSLCRIQSLHCHLSLVCQVKWPKSCVNDHQILLASADSSGLIVVWDVAKGTPIHQFSEKTQSILGLNWIFDHTNDCHYLLVMQQPSAICLFNLQDGKLVWKKAFQTEVIYGGDLDPFYPNRAAVHCNGGILLIEDISVSKVPNVCRKFYVSLPKVNSSPSNESLKTREKLRKLVKEFVVGEAAPSRQEETVECLQTCFHQGVRDMLILLYPRECLLMDLFLGQTVAVISADRNSSQFSKVVSLRQRNGFFFFHESGSVSARFLHPQAYLKDGARQSASDINWSSQALFTDASNDLVYDQKCQVDFIRLTSVNRFLGGAVNPFTERHLYVFTMDGRIFQLEFRQNGSKFEEYDSISDMLPPLRSSNPFELKFNYRLLPTGMIGDMTSSSRVIRACPKTERQSEGQPNQFVAAGGKNGSVYLLNVSTGIVEKEMSVHNNPILGIEWTSDQSILSYSQSVSSSNPSRFKNEIVYTHFENGEHLPLKREADSEPPVIMIRISPSRKVFIIVIKDSPIELWDTISLTLIRVMPKMFPPVASLEWHSNSKVKFSGKEKVIFADGESQKVYVMSIEGSILSEGKTLPTKGIVGKVSCVCWKNDLVVMGDVEGNVIVWDTKNGIYKRIEIQKSPVKKVMFDNEQAKRLAILTTNNLEIWDLSQDLLYGQCQWPMKYSVRVRDFDWLSSNALAMACSDGVIRVTDPSLKTNPSLLINYPGQLRSVGAIPWLLREFLKRWLIFRKYLGEDLSVVSSLEPSHISILNRFWDGIQDSTKKKLLSESTTLAEKAYLVSKLFGSVEEVDLWTLAFHYIKGQPQIDVNFDYLTDQQLSKSHMMEKLQLYESRRSNSEQTRRIARDFLMLGETGKAASLLLDISQSEPSFYQDHLLACLISLAEDRTSEKFSSTIKLVATSLMTGGKLWEGIELLVLAGRTSDACNYLQSSGKWPESARIARASLDKERTTELMRKWAEYLFQNKNKIASIQVLVSVCDMVSAVEYAMMSQDPVLAGCIASLVTEVPENLQNSLMQSLKNDLSKSGFKVPMDFSIF